MANINLRRHYAVNVASQLRRWLRSQKIKARVRAWTELVNPRIQIQCFPPSNRPLLGPQPENIVFPDWLIDAVNQIGFGGYHPVFNDSDLMMYPSQWEALMNSVSKRYNPDNFLLQRLRERIYSDEEDEVYVVDDFVDVGSLSLVEEALDQLVETEENFFKLSDKIYHRARWVKWVNRWGAADIRKCLQAILRYDGHKTIMTGAIAANGLGLSTQVQARNLYMTDGPSRTEKIGSWNIEFQHADDDVMFWANHPGAVVIQGLRWMGQTWVSSHQDLVIHRLRESSWRNDEMPDHIRSDLQENLDHVPGWMQSIIRKILI